MTEPTERDKPVEDDEREQTNVDKSDWRDVQDNPWQPDESAPPPVIGE